MIDIKRKKGQEEIVGFVVIVVLVSIVLLVFLGIIIRQDSSAGELESVELFQFLESSMEYTSSCATSYVPDYSSLGELLEKCQSGEGICTSGERPCDVLERTFEEILDDSYFTSEDGEVKGYEFRSEYNERGSDLTEELILIEMGECTNRSVIGSELPTFAYSGTIVSSLKLCV
jgi:hypothetical protein